MLENFGTHLKLPMTKRAAFTMCMVLVLASTSCSVGTTSGFVLPSSCNGLHSPVSKTSLASTSSAARRRNINSLCARSHKNSFPKFHLLIKNKQFSRRVSVAGSSTDTSSSAPPDVTAWTDGQDAGDAFGPLLPAAQAIDDFTGGWGLSYADLTPETESTPIGMTFLATNLAYSFVGAALATGGFGVAGTTSNGIILGTLTELAGFASMWYHFSQLKLGPNRVEVRLALFVDYVMAGTALLTGLVYAIQMTLTGAGVIPMEGFVFAGLSVGALCMSWVYEFGTSYIFWHSLWHLLSAATAYVVGQTFPSW